MFEYADKFSGEPDTPYIYDDFESRLAYVLLSLFNQLSDQKSIWVKVNEDYDLYNYLLDKEYKTNRNSKYIRKVKGRYEDLFFLDTFSSMAHHYLYGFLEMLQREANINRVKVKCKPGELTYNLHWVDPMLKDKKQTVTVGSEEVVEIGDFWAFENCYIDEPIPIPLLYNEQFILDFLFSESTKIRICSTLSPLDKKLLEKYGIDDQYVDLCNKDDGRLIALAKDFEVLYNGQSLYLDEQSRVRLKVHNYPFKRWRE